MGSIPEGIFFISSSINIFGISKDAAKEFASFSFKSSPVVESEFLKRTNSFLLINKGVSLCKTKCPNSCAIVKFCLCGASFSLNRI